MSQDDWYTIGRDLGTSTPGATLCGLNESGVRLLRDKYKSLSDSHGALTENMSCHAVSEDEYRRAWWLFGKAAKPTMDALAVALGHGHSVGMDGGMVTVMYIDDEKYVYRSAWFPPEVLFQFTTEEIVTMVKREMGGES